MRKGRRAKKRADRVGEVAHHLFLLVPCGSRCLRPERRQRIDTKHAPRRDIGSEQRDSQKEKSRQRRRSRVGRPTPKRKSRERPAAANDPARPMPDAGECEHHSVADDRQHDLTGTRAERHADADLARPLGNRITDQPVHAHGRRA